MDEELNMYDLTRDWWNFCFENPEKIKPVHSALYLFAIEHCNRLAWKRKFGLPTTMAMEAIGVKSYNTYIGALRDLIRWGFIKMIEKSRNQHSSNIVALSKNDKAHDKALDKAMYKHATKHATKHSESTQQSTDSINRPYTYIPDTIYHIPYTGVGDDFCSVKKILQSVPIPDSLNSTDFQKAFYDYTLYMKDKYREQPNIKQIENRYQKLIELQYSGNEPTEVIRQTITAGNKSFYELTKFKSKTNERKEPDAHKIFARARKTAQDLQRFESE